MSSGYSFDLRPLIWFGLVVGLLIWGCWELVDWLFIDDSIRTKIPIKPKIEFVIDEDSNGKQVVDTVYVYEKP